jgi:hypothetical protein
VWRMLPDSSCCDAGESGGKTCALCGECCLTVAVVMLESRVARCVHCVENVAWLWLPINHYLFTYLSKMHGHSNINYTNLVYAAVSNKYNIP